MKPETLPEVVYHYTSADTLLKIVEFKTIWATNLRYLNDVKESDHCIEMFRKHSPPFLENLNPDDAALLRAALDTIETGFEGSPYVSSFSQYSDSLPQWRSYCPTGNGVSIGFRTNALNKGTLYTGSQLDTNRLPSFSSLHKVHYLTVEDFRLADELLFQCVIEFSSLKGLYGGMKVNFGDAPDDDSPESGVPTDLQILQSQIASTASRVKHWAFSNEAEYRLIAPHDYFSSAVRFRPTRSTVIPYIPVHLPERHGQTFADLVANGYFIKEVIVGPTPNADLTVWALEECFRRQQADVKVLKSVVPYRDL